PGDVVTSRRDLPAPGPHGGDGPAVAAALGLDPATVLDLSQSLNPVAPDVTPVVAAHLGALGTYPDPTAATAALAGAMGIDPARVLLTNGGAQAIALVAAELGGRVEEPEFSLHPRSGGPLWRSNPHNPTGVLAAASARAAVWDEAFYPLAAGTWTRGDAGAIVVGSLTKLLACPGLRVGYVLGDAEVIARLRARQPAWSVNALATAALPELLAATDLPSWSVAIANLRRDLVDVLARHGLSARPSQANWVLVDAPGLRAELAPAGIVVRDCASFGLPGTVRVAVPSAEGLERLDHALASRDDPGRRTASPEERPPSRPLERTT
ncbi:MAG TPA: aminotransferase class I/II-fold pyridoxal phosphate-dependent enzyme, partial [Candidatus Sulfotelmatobacter sp.]|nr:aminotransferase class I/II-fold pyridoxal phosphate-dependent enzyme [Candidatus Sulfotelmatobacter sp.]